MTIKRVMSIVYVEMNLIMINQQQSLTGQEGNIGSLQKRNQIVVE